VIPHQRRLGTALALAGFAFVLVSTLTPVSDPRGAAAITPLSCLVCGDQGGADVVVNLFLFLPFAIGLRLAGETWKRTVLAVFLTSFSVELLQYWLVPGRDTSLSDLLTNTFSGVIGATIATYLPRWSSPDARSARLLAVAWLGIILVVLFCWAWLLAPGVPSGQLMSRWAHEAPGRDVFKGRVQSVHLDGLPMPRNGTPPDSAALRQRLQHGVYSLDAEVISGLPVRDRLWIYMFRVPSGGVLALNQGGREAGVAIPVRGLRFRLHHPVLTLPDGFPLSAGVTVRLHAAQSSGQIRLSSRYSGSEREIVLGVSPALGWMLFAPFEVAAGLALRWVTGAVLAAMLLPLGYWGAWARPRWFGLALVLAGLVLALAVVPKVMGHPPVHWSEWLAGTTGAVVGWVLQRAVVSFRERERLRSDRKVSPVSPA
jgi:hypothetical protein